MVRQHRESSNTEYRLAVNRKTTNWDGSNALSDKILALSNAPADPTAPKQWPASAVVYSKCVLDTSTVDSEPVSCIRVNRIYRASVYAWIFLPLRPPYPSPLL